MGFRTVLAWFLASCFVALSPLPARADPPSDAPHLPWFLGRGRIGLQVQPMTPELREHFGAPRDRGVLVVRVEPDRPAAKAGVAVGDVALSLDGEPVDTPAQLATAIRGVPEGASVKLVVLRNRKERTLELAPDPPEPLWGPEAEEWLERFERDLDSGSRHLERRLRELERNFEELRRDFEKRLRELEGDLQQRT